MNLNTTSTSEAQQLESDHLLTANLKLSPETERVLEGCRVRSFIAPLIQAVHAKQAQSIGIFSYLSEDSARLASQVLTIAISQQIDRKCAMIVSEGLRMQVSNYNSFALVTVPEVDLVPSERVADFLTSMNRNFPFQIFVAPEIGKWPKTETRKADLPLSTDAKFLLVPAEGLSRNTAREVERFTRAHKIKWMGIITVEGASP